MIRYTLACEAGHEFESWFPSSGAFDEQCARGLVACPYCGSLKVGKTLMAPAVARAARDAAPGTPPVEVGAVPVPAGPRSGLEPMIAEPERRLRALLNAMREHVTRTADPVGARFPDVARAMHYGETPSRAIYGEASLDEARALIEEGIAVALLPPAPDDRN